MSSAQAIPAAPAPFTTTLMRAMSFSDNLEPVEKRRAGDDRRAVLVIVEYRNVELALEGFLDVEAVGRLDVLEVDPAERGLEGFDHFDDVIGLGGLELDVEDIDVRETLEEDSFSFHHRLRRERTDVAEAENRGAVRDHRHQIALGRVGEYVLGISLDLEAGLGDAGTVCEREIALGLGRLGRPDLDLAAASLRVIVQSVLLPNHETSIYGARTESKQGMLSKRVDSW